MVELKFMEKLKKRKEMKREQWLIVLLAGVLLFLIVLPSGTKKTEDGTQQQTEETAEVSQEESEKSEALKRIWSGGWKRCWGK